MNVDEPVRRIRQWNRAKRNRRRRDGDQGDKGNRGGKDGNEAWGWHSGNRICGLTSAESQISAYSSSSMITWVSISPASVCLGMRPSLLLNLYHDAGAREIETKRTATNGHCVAYLRADQRRHTMVGMSRWGASQIFGPEVCRSDQTAFRRVSRPCSHEHASYCQYSAIIWDAPVAFADLNPVTLWCRMRHWRCRRTLPVASIG